MKLPRTLPALPYFAAGLLFSGCAFSPRPAAFKFDQPIAAIEPAKTETIIPPNVDRPSGQIMALTVVDDVELVASDGSCQTLKRGQIFTEGNTVRTLPGSNVLIVFSNGVVMEIYENSEMQVTQFKQEKFDAQMDGTFLRLNKDPSKSTTLINLRSGSVMCEVKKINRGEGSKFNIYTPVGSFAVLGTVFTISLARNPAGQLTELVESCFLGGLEFSADAKLAPENPRSAISSSVELLTSGGSQITLNMSTDPATGLIRGGTFIGAKLPRQISQEMVDELVDAVNTATTTGLPAQPPPTVPGGIAPSYYPVEALMDFQITPQISSAMAASHDLPIGPPAPIVLPTTPLTKVGDCQ